LDLTEAEMKFSGIDLHSNNRMVVISDAEDRIVLKRRLLDDLGAIPAALAPLLDELAGVIVEWFRRSKVSVSSNNDMWRIAYETSE
jgi:hypothetical protein